MVAMVKSKSVTKSVTKSESVNAKPFNRKAASKAGAVHPYELVNSAVRSAMRDALGACEPVLVYGLLGDRVVDHVLENVESRRVLTKVAESIRSLIEVEPKIVWRIHPIIANLESAVAEIEKIHDWTPGEDRGDEIAVKGILLSCAIGSVRNAMKAMAKLIAVCC